MYLREQLDRVVEFVGVRRNGSVRYDEMVGGMLFGVDESVFVDDDDGDGDEALERSAVQIQRLYRGYSVRRRPAAAPTKREKREMGLFRKEYESALGKLLEGGGLYRVLEEMRSVSGGGGSWKAERVGVALGGELPVGVVAGCVRVADKGRGGGRGGCVVAP